MSHDESPDPRHARGSSAAGTIVVVALVLGGLVLLVVVGGTAALFFAVRAKNVAVRADQQEAVLQVDAKAPETARTAEVKNGEPERVVALKDAVTIDGLTVRVVSVEVGKAKFKPQVGVKDDDKPQLLVKVELKAENPNRKFDYVTWRLTDLSHRMAVDEFGNEYFRRRPQSEIDGFTKFKSLRSGESVEDLLVFEAPLASAERIHLDLPGKEAGVEGMFRFRIPRAAWEKK